jgi:hypothetical protein
VEIDKKPRRRLVCRFCNGNDGKHAVDCYGKILDEAIAALEEPNMVEVEIDARGRIIRKYAQ